MGTLLVLTQFKFWGEIGITSVGGDQDIHLVEKIEGGRLITAIYKEPHVKGSFDALDAAGPISGMVGIRRQIARTDSDRAGNTQSNPGTARGRQERGKGRQETRPDGCGGYVALSQSGKGVFRREVGGETRSWRRISARTDTCHRHRTTRRSRPPPTKNCWTASTTCTTGRRVRSVDVSKPWRR